MRMMYCHDGPLFRDQFGENYSLGLSNQVFERYSSITDEIDLAIRIRNLKKEEIEGRMSPIDLPYLNVIDSPNLSSIKGLVVDRKNFRAELEEHAKKADFIICRLPSHIGNLGVDVAKKLNKPYLIEMVACPWDSLWNYNFKGKFVAPFFKMATKKRVRNASHVVYVTNEFLQNRYPTLGASTNCSNVLLNSVEDKVREERLKKIQSIPTRKMVIGTTGSVDIKFKGQKFVIKALSKLKKEGYTNIEYQLVGKGDPAYLKKVCEYYDVSEMVKFLGPKKHEDVFKWLDTIDLYCQPSKQEGLPRGLIEAMSRALPAFGARTGGIPELLNDHYVVDRIEKDIDKIASLIKEFDVASMREQAIRNHEESKLYLHRSIEERRQVFLKKFMEDSNLNQ